MLIAPNKRESIVLKKMVDEAPLTDILPDINSALAYIQLKELARNSALRAEINTIYVRSLLQGRHKTINQQGEGTRDGLFISGDFVQRFERSQAIHEPARKSRLKTLLPFRVAEKLGETLEGCINAKSLLMRCVLFPLYPRIGQQQYYQSCKNSCNFYPEPWYLSCMR